MKRHPATGAGTVESACELIISWSPRALPAEFASARFTGEALNSKVRCPVSFLMLILDVINASWLGTGHIQTSVCSWRMATARSASTTHVLGAVQTMSQNTALHLPSFLLVFKDFPTPTRSICNLPLTNTHVIHSGSSCLYFCCFQVSWAQIIAPSRLYFYHDSIWAKGCVTWFNHTWARHRTEYHSVCQCEEYHADGPPTFSSRDLSSLLVRAGSGAYPSWQSWWCQSSCLSSHQSRCSPASDGERTR